MADSEDCQLTDLQSEFKKLRVDLNCMCPLQKDSSICSSKSQIGSNKSRDLSPIFLNSSKTEQCKCRSNTSCGKVLSRKKKKKWLKKRHSNLEKAPSENDFVLQCRLNDFVEAVRHSDESQQCLNDDLLESRFAISLQYVAEESSQEHSDDITVDELAGYFDNFVYIPKKMSHMAEMMYT